MQYEHIMSSATRGIVGYDTMSYALYIRYVG